MTDPPNNGIRTGAQIVRAWWPIVGFLFVIFGGWFTLQGRVSAVEQDNRNLKEVVNDIKDDVKWLRNNVITK